MEYLIKQTGRMRFSNQQSAEGQRKIPAQKTPSSKEDKKRPQNWFRRQISWRMNQDFDSNGIEQVAAVAAATYAVSSSKDSTNIPKQKKISQDLEPSFTRNKSRKEVSIAEPGRVSKKFSGKDTMRNTEIPDEKTPVKVPGSPSMKKTPTFTDKPALPMEKIPNFAEEQLIRSSDEIQPESLKPKPDLQPIKKTGKPVPEPDVPATAQPPISPAKFDRQASTRPGIGGGTQADVWEGAELAKIKKKYDELEARILSWEHKKKAKSRRRLDKTESELEKKRLKALELFRSEVNDINEIAEGARAKAKDRQRNEELKAKAKANQIRQTGQDPRTCSCF